MRYLGQIIFGSLNAFKIYFHSVWNSEREWERERHKENVYSSGSLLRCLKQPGLGQSKGRRAKLPLGLPWLLCTQVLSHHLLPARCALAGACTQVLELPSATFYWELARSLDRAEEAVQYGMSVSWISWRVSQWPCQVPSPNTLIIQVEKGCFFCLSVYPSLSSICITERPRSLNQYCFNCNAFPLYSLIPLSSPFKVLIT